MGKNRKQASLTNVVQYDSNFNLSIGTSTSSSFNSSGSIIAASGFTGSLSGSVFGLGNTVSFSSSVSSDLINLESKSASVDISISNINSFTASNANTSLNQLSGSYATTGSNSFYGTQVFSGSVYIANDLVVQGSSSIQYISASSVSIGTNIIQLNTANPSVRFAGLTIIDSGSVGGSGSFLYDSLQDEMIFIHRGNGANITSSHFILGPETYDNIGNELYLTANRLPKGTGKEHLIDSCIYESGSRVGINTATPSYNLDVTGCGRFYQSLTNSTSYLIVENNRARNAAVYTATTNGGFYTGTSIGTDTFNYQIYDGVAGQARLTISSTGITNFACQICAPSYTACGTSRFFNVPDVSSTAYRYMEVSNAGASMYWGVERSTAGGLLYNSDVYSTVFSTTNATNLNFGTNLYKRFTIDCTGISTFTCTVCAPIATLSNYVQAPGLYGKSYSQTSTSGAYSIVDTGIYNSIDYSSGMIWLVSYGGNPLAAGSNYFANYLGALSVTTGYIGGSVKQYIVYTPITQFDASGVGALSLTAVFWNGTTELTTIPNSNTSYQIRLKIGTYNPVGYGQYVYLLKMG
jgi:hypothetical protein